MTNLFIFKHTSLRNYRVKPNPNHEKPAMEKRERISKQLKVRLIIHRAEISSHNRLEGIGRSESLNKNVFLVSSQQEMPWNDRDMANVWNVS